jgi:prepilin-type N-terminal cleavage/methylation domain-containing protein
MKDLTAQNRQKGFNLVELLVTVSIFSLLGLVMANITSAFVDVYTRSRDQADLQTVSAALVKEISNGDDQFFDGMKNALQIIEATDRSLSFVPQYRENSNHIGSYAESYQNLVASYEQEGPPRIDGRYQGGLRLQYNTSRELYELRYYLSKHPRAGSDPPIVYLDRVREPELPTLEKLQLLPVNLVWQTPIDNMIPCSYIVFHGGHSPLSFAGDATMPPLEVVVQEQMAENSGQLFPNPFQNPNDRLIIYYQPEVEPSLIQGQESLIAHLFFKNAHPGQAANYYFSDDAITKFNRFILDDSLLLYYDDRLEILPTNTALINSYFPESRIQFPTTVTADSQQEPSRFRYFSSLDTSKEIEFEEQEFIQKIPPDTINNISLVQLDFLMIVGASTENFRLDQISQRNFSHIISLDTLSYTQAYSTKASSVNPALGFQAINCPPGSVAGSRCRRITRTFPSGKLIKASQTFYVNNITFDQSQSSAPEGIISFLITRSNFESYVVRVNFDAGKTYIILKNNLSDQEPAYDGNNPNVMEFAIDNTQFIDFTNIQGSGFLDEGFNYTNTEVYEEHFRDVETLDFFVELSDSSNIEGFSLTYSPR